MCWQEVATAVLMSQGFEKVQWLTWVVCWQEVATAVLMRHGFVGLKFGDEVGLGDGNTFC